MITLKMMITMVPSVKDNHHCVHHYKEDHYWSSTLDSNYHWWNLHQWNDHHQQSDAHHQNKCHHYLSIIIIRMIIIIKKLKIKVINVIRMMNIMMMFNIIKMVWWSWLLQADGPSENAGNGSIWPVINVIKLAPIDDKFIKKKSLNRDIVLKYTDTFLDLLLLIFLFQIY